ncbi:hypothetical protein R1sor_005640 [Riccia sorocarpa]|uniref:EF-hand domain-containing protein n=1 Tax=Riccia sorocarpa TaxID=122646 RepID=A0ABD3HNM4_9MARC
MGGEDSEGESSPSMENDVSGVTEYEKERLERIKRNRDMLANLHVQDIATKLDSPEKKAKGQSRKGKEKVDPGVYPRRVTRLSTRTKTPTKIVDWSSGESDGDSEDAPESDSGHKSRSKSSARKKGQRKRKTSSSEEGLDDDEVLKKKQEDDEYEPDDASESDQEEEDEVDEVEDDTTLPGSEKKQKSRNIRPPRKKEDFGKFAFRLKPLKPLASPTKLSNEGSKDGDLDGDDPELEEAIRLSLSQDAEDLSLKSPGAAKGTGAPKQRKRKGGRDLKFSEAEVDAYFAAIAGSGVGPISLQLLEKAAIAHDFIWSEEDLQDMIDVFDENDDGFLSLPEFRAMATRCSYASPEDFPTELCHPLLPEHALVVDSVLILL